MITNIHSGEMFLSTAAISRASSMAIVDEVEAVDELSEDESRSASAALLFIVEGRGVVGYCC
jgi:hypothetical protein